jgi:hypothetical protein
MSYGQISTNLGLSKSTIHAIMRKWQHTGTWDGCSASRFWKKAGVFRGTERGTPELSPKSVPVHEEQIALGCTTKWSNDQILTSSVFDCNYIPFTMFWHKGRLWFHFLTLDTCLISVISAVTKVLNTLFDFRH